MKGAVVYWGPRRRPEFRELPKCRIAQHYLEVHGYYISGVKSRVTIVLTHIEGLITPLTTTHEPPSKRKARKFGQGTGIPDQQETEEVVMVLKTLRVWFRGLGFQGLGFRV